MSGSRKAFAATTPARLAPVAALSRGRPLETGVRRTMESRFRHDFGAVRIHADAEAGRSAAGLDARAYTDRTDIVFGSGEYRPETSRGRRLLAHELAHVAQLRQPGAGSDAEARARDAGARVARGEPVSAGQLGSAAPGIHRQPTGEPDEEAPKLEFNPMLLPWSALAQLPELQPPSFVRPPTPPRFFDMPVFAPGASGSTPSLPFPPFPPLQAPGLPPPALPPGPLAPRPMALTPPPSSASAPAASPDLPSRVGVTDFGRLSLGLRFGLPVAPDSIPGTPPDRRKQPKGFAGPTALDVSNYQFELLDMSITGKVPHGFDAIDKGDLAKSIFGIVSTYIAPDLVKSLAQKVSGKPGADWQVDLTINGDFKGGGITFSMPTDKPKPRPKPAAPANEAKR